MLTLDEMKYSLGLQVFTAYSMDSVDGRSGKWNFRKDKRLLFYFFQCIFWRNVTSNQKLTQIYK